MADPIVEVPENLLRRATARIDSLDRENVWLRHEVALRDSVHSMYKGEWEAQLADAYAWGDRWQSVAQSWWHRHESAFWVVLGMLAAGFALH